MKRRDFLKQGSLFFAAVSIYGCSSLSSTQRQKDKVEEADPTTQDILGPFYRKGAPIRSKIAPKNHPEEKVIIKGRVFHKNGQDVLNNAKVEIWHADAKGAYDNKSDAYLYRGTQMSDKDGLYKFETILPGRYLNGKQYRPMHYHFRVNADEHKELISQIYIKGDPYIEKDPWASSPKALLRILENKQLDNGVTEITFDIHLG